MLQTRLVRGWRAGCDVAWRTVGAARISIGEWIAEIAPSLDQPFLFDDLVSTIESFSGCKPETIATQVNQSDEVLGLGAGEYAARGAFFPTEEAWQNACSAVGAVLPEDDAISAATLVGRCSLPGVPQKLAGPVLWAVARALPGVRSRAVGRLVWRESHATTTWSALRRGTSWTLPAVFRVDDLANWLIRSHGIDSRRLAWLLIGEGREEGALHELGEGSFRDLQAPAGAQPANRGWIHALREAKETSS